MGRIYFVRHGETVWNREKRIAGSTDVALTEKGREEAEERKGSGCDGTKGRQNLLFSSFQSL